MVEYSSTAVRILDVTQELIQKRGYNAISFNDIALKVGIKKPSVIHHFSSKSVLGLAVVRRYRQVFSKCIEGLLSQPDNTALFIFDSYCKPYTDFGESNDKICLCGALAGELMALPDELKSEVALFFEEHISLLTIILQRGLNDSSLAFTGDINTLAQHILNTLQGSLIIKRASGDEVYLSTTVELLRSQICGVGS